MKRAIQVSCVAFLFSTTSFAGEIFDLYYKSHAGTFPISSHSRTYAEIQHGDSEIKEIGIERYPCLGSCPVYAFIVKNDGSFRYTGIAHVDHVGKFSGKIRLWRWSRVVQCIKELDYFSLDERYQIGATDQDTVFTTVLRGNQRKMISNYGSAGPSRLWAIEVLIDTLLLDATWDEPK